MWATQPWASTSWSSHLVTPEKDAQNVIEQRTYLLEVEGHNGTSPIVLRYSNGYGYTTQATDTPPVTTYEPRVIQAGNYEISAFRPGTTSGVSRQGVGEIILRNTDGDLDSLLDLGFSGRKVRIKRVPNEEAALSEAVTVFTGTLEQAEFDVSEVTFFIRDRLNVLKTDIQENLYAGTTTSGVAGGAEGDETLKDRVKPLVFGRVLNVTAQPADRFNLIYQVSDNPIDSIDGVFDQGAGILFDGNDYETLSELEGASVQAGRYATALKIGMFKLGASPNGNITADVTEGVTSGDRTTAQVVKRILLNQANLTQSDLVNASFQGLDSVASEEVGVFVNNQRDVFNVVVEVLRSVGAFLVVTATGNFAVYQMDVPSGSDTPSASFDSDTILRDFGLRRLSTGDEGRGVPSWRVNVRHRKNYTVQERDQLAGCVDQASREFLDTEKRVSTASDSSVKTQHKLSPEMTFETLLVNRSAADSEANRLLDLYKVRRDRYEFQVNSLQADNLNVNDVIRLTFDRFGLSGGKLFRIIGLTRDYDRDITTIDCWGGI